MGDAVAGPDVVLVDLHRAAAEPLGRFELVGFLEGEGAAAEHETVSRHVFGPVRHDAGHRIAHLRQVAEKEMHRVRDTQREQIVPPRYRPRSTYCARISRG